MTYYNEEETKKLKELPKYTNFKRWCDDNGIVNTGVDFPVAFGLKGVLIGMAASKDIAPCEAFLYVPWEI